MRTLTIIMVASEASFGGKKYGRQQGTWSYEAELNNSKANQAKRGWGSPTHMLLPAAPCTAGWESSPLRPELAVSGVQPSAPARASPFFHTQTALLFSAVRDAMASF